MQGITAAALLSGHHLDRKRWAGELDDRSVDAIFEGIRRGVLPTLMGFTLAYILGLAGREAEGRWILEEARKPGRLAHLPGRSYALCSLALLAVELGAREHCESLYRELEAYEGQWVVKSSTSWTGFGPIARYRGLLAGGLDDETRALRHLSDAVEACRRLPSPVWLAQVQLDLSTLLTRTPSGRQRQEASRLANAALETASRLDLKVIEQQSRELISKLASVPRLEARAVDR